MLLAYGVAGDTGQIDGGLDFENEIRYLEAMMDTHFSMTAPLQLLQRSIAVLIFAFLTVQQGFAKPVDIGVDRRVVLADKINKQHGVVRSTRPAVDAAHQSDAGARSVLLKPNASPSDLPANSGRKTVRFSVPLLVKDKSSAIVYLRRSGDKSVIAMNDLGKAGDVKARDGIHGVDVQIDTSKVKPDSCLRYEAFIKQGRSELVSPASLVCVSSFPVSLAEPNIEHPAMFPDGSKAVADEILLTVTPKTTAAVIRELARSVHANVVGSYPSLYLYQLKLSSPTDVNQLLEISAQLKRRAGVISASINAIGQFASGVNDPEFNPPLNSQHGLKMVLAHNDATNANAWDAGATGNGVTVIVLDAGLDRTHPDFGTAGACQFIDDGTNGGCVTGVNNDLAIGIDAGHGTQVAGVIAAKTNNTRGVAGVAPDSKVYSIQVSPNTNVVSTQMVTGFHAARDYMATHAEASVINASFFAAGATATAADWALVCGAIEEVVFNGTPRAVVVNAVGNNNVNAVVYPARCKDMNIELAHKDLFITVSNSASVVTPACGSVAIDQRCSSNYGAWVDIAAPGSEIRTTTIGNTYISATGNSFSAPLVAGAAAILRSCNMPPQLINPTLKASSIVPVPYPAFGANPAGNTPRLDIHRAISYRAPTGIGLNPGNSINENNVAGATVAMLTATDLDTCDKFTFTLVAGVGAIDNVAFNITGDQLTINGVADYETKTSYSIRVQVTDFGGLHFEQPLTVNVNDRNDNAPVITTAVAQNVNENAAFSVPLTSTDVDTVGSNPATFSITGGADAALFSIVAGNLTMTAKDFEAPIDAGANNTYVVQVTANDGVNNTVKTITVTVNDVIEPPTGNPSIVGTRTVGQQLNADLASIVNPESWSLSTYQWRRSGVDIALNGNGSNYTLVSADVGAYMSLCVTYTHGANSTTLCSGLDATAVGDPHITTVDGLHYDFQSAGEFVALRGANGMEIQTRHTPVSTASAITDPYSGLTSGVSINTAVAARVGRYRVTLQSDLSSATASAAMVLRVDGGLAAIPANGLTLGAGGRLVQLPGGAIQVDFPDQTTMVVTPGWWAPHNVWYLNVSVMHTSAYTGLMGARGPNSWLPRLADGSSLGAMPAELPDRYVDMYEKFADSWRVSSKTSLFDYTLDTSTRTYTYTDWPKRKPPFIAPRGPVAQPVKQQVALRACRAIRGKTEHADCVFDVMVTGHAGFAQTYLLSQRIQAGLTRTSVQDDKATSKDKETVIYTATVERNTTAAAGDSAARVMPTGAVQFVLGDSRVGGPVKLDKLGQARVKLPKLKVGSLSIVAHYLPAKGSVFLPSTSLDETLKLSR